MGRAPCCEKVGLNRGPWTKEEDQILINFINQDGHGNWRALPKKAGLLRCGKSCRLRWTNYLRPDIIRGNFTKEEEDNIIAFHKELGNKWSIIASKLPGRTDNEIKNVWHTHLKKRLVDKNNSPLVEHKKRIRKRTKKIIETKKETLGTLKSNKQEEGANLQNTKDDEKNSPSQEAKSQNSSLTSMSTSGCSASTPESMEEFVIDDEFWTDVFSGDCPNMDINQIPESQFALPSFMDMVDFDPSRDEDMGFWHNFFTKEGELQLQELL